MDTTRRFLFIGLFFLGGWASHAQANLTVCGVDLRGNPRCHRELKRLVAGCKEQPVICGRSYQYGPLPNLEEVTQRCNLWHRSHRRKWVTGMCGIPLYSAPRTFCGRKGMEVAISCIRNVRAKQPEIPMTRHDAPTPTPTLTPTPARAPSQITPSPSSHPNAPTVAPRDSASDAAPSTHQDTHNAQEATPQNPPSSASTTQRDPRTGSLAQISAPSAPASQGTGVWLWAVLLQLLTLCLVIFLLQQRPTPESAKQARRSLQDDEDAWVDGSHQDAKDDHSVAISDLLHEVQRRLDHSTEQIEQIVSQQAAAPAQVPFAALQREADEMLRYYSGIARVVLQDTAKARPAVFQQRLIEARERLQWIFQGHREHNVRALSLHNFQEETLALIDALLERMGYLDLPLLIQQHLTQGQFSFREYLHRIEVDQAEYIRRAQSPQSFKEVRESFMARIESLYRNNLLSLQKQPIPQHTMPEDEQAELYQQRYVRAFLLKELPRQLRSLARQSSPGRIGALVDMLVQFIEDQVLQSGLSITFPEDAALEESMMGRIVRLEKARITEESSSASADLSAAMQRMDQAFGALSLQAPPSDSASHTLEPGALPEALSHPVIANPDSDPPELAWEAPRGTFGSSELDALQANVGHTLGTRPNGTHPTTNSYNTLSK
ncbi:hypothetical protein L6R29_14815 [Myxococcota bacterium]|nr:hypothetical protein [Myxococcota bacterium]